MKFLNKCLIVFIFILNIIFIVHYFNVKVETSENSEISEIKSNCGRLPKESDIVFDGSTWQVLKTIDGNTLYLKNAYLDERGNKSIVITVLGEGIKMYDETIFCHIWSKGEIEPIVVEAVLVGGAKPKI